MIFERKKTIKAADKFIEDVQNLPKEIKEKTIILIGPMGTGKSSIAKLLAEKYLEMPRIGLDNKEQLKLLYDKRKKFKESKNFEFMLTGMVLSSLTEPAIIDFGAGHSIYESQALKEKMQEITSNFKNIFLLLPSENKEQSRKILLQRRNIKNGSHKDKDNWHFIIAPDNYKIATDVIYEDYKDPSCTAEEIIEQYQKNIHEEGKEI